MKNTDKTASTNLSKNIKYLRRVNDWSQEELATQLGIKRSSVAAYESKNVEPKLAVILKLAKLFNVNLTQFIEQDISKQSEEVIPFSLQPLNNKGRNSIAIRLPNEAALSTFVEQTTNARKMIDGLRIFYRLKRQETTLKDNALVNTDSFFELVDHLLNKNEDFISILNRNIK